MLAKALQGAALATIPAYIEDVFSTWLYTGNGSTQTITNGIDLSTKGGLVWTKSRSNATSSELRDTLRGVTKSLRPDSTAAEATDTGNALTAFNSDGFSLGADTWFTTTNVNGRTYVSWTFRKQAKFFDVVTYTGNGTARTIPHNLGSVPGCIIVKSLGAATQGGIDGWWNVYHRGLSTPASGAVFLNSTDERNTSGVWNSTSPTITEFSVSSSSDTTNITGRQYVAYLFAHDAGGFGAAGTDNVISCGSYTGNGTTGLAVTLGYEPQWIMIKCSSAAQADGWIMVDNMRGMDNSANAWLKANTSGAETAESPRIVPTATGFTLSSNAAVNTNAATYIYIAIRRGPMRTPTSGTSVFSPQIYTEIITNPTTLTTGWPTDLHLISRRTGTTTFYVADRLRGSVLGNENFLETPSTVAETDYSSSPPLFTSNTGIVITNLFNNTSGATDISYQFRRAPGFFDVVCYTGVASPFIVTNSHNLTVVPELIIGKARNVSDSWFVYHKDLGASTALNLNTTAAAASSGNFGNTAPTATQFTTAVGSNTTTLVAYLFATVTGVSKVGSYQGNGTSKTIDCGFTAGARFVMIKRTDSTGDWYVWDTARGIVSGNDPRLSLNSTAAEVTTDDSVDADSSGFIVNQLAATNINVNNASYIFLAVS